MKSKSFFIKILFVVICLSLFVACFSLTTFASDNPSTLSSFTLIIHQRGNPSINKTLYLTCDINDTWGDYIGGVYDTTGGIFDIDNGMVVSLIGGIFGYLAPGDIEVEEVSASSPIIGTAVANEYVLSIDNWALVSNYLEGTYRVVDVNRWFDTDRTSYYISYDLPFEYNGTSYNRLSFYRSRTGSGTIRCQYIEGDVSIRNVSTSINGGTFTFFGSTVPSPFNTLVYVKMEYLSSPGYDDGYSDGYSIGYEEGYDEGYGSGYYQGYDEGYSLGLGSDNTDAYNEGYSHGFDDGVSSADGDSFFTNFFTNILNALDALKIIGGFSVLDIIRTIIGLFVTVWILKLIAGG